MWLDGNWLQNFAGVKEDKLDTINQWANKWPRLEQVPDMHGG